MSTLEPDPERQLKYADYLDIYSAPDDNERKRYERDYPQETQAMRTYLQKIRQEGEVLMLVRQLRLKFGEIPDEALRRIEEADADTLVTWSERILTTERLEDVIH